MKFLDLDLHENLLKAIEVAGYTEPTPVQEEAIPAALAGKDLLVSSRTGSGKTAAFVLPAMHRIILKQEEKSSNSGDSAQQVTPRERRRNDAPRFRVAEPFMLVLTPTRELAVQVTDAVSKYGKYSNIKAGSILGGMPYFKQLKMLSSAPDILVATPGRLLDHLRAGKISFKNLQVLVLDEADRMLDMGFVDDIEDIVSNTSANRQTLLFSATLDGKVGKVARDITSEPQTIKIANVEVKHDNITQSVHVVDDMEHKIRLLMHMIQDEGINQAVIFVGMKRDADELAEHLKDEGVVAEPLHGDMSQGHRNRILKAVREGKVKFLVATNVAARGIDVPTISHVFNLDIPKVHEEYIHRIGRTGRAGRSGVATSFATHAEMREIEQIENLIKRTISIGSIEGFEPRRAYVKQARGQKARGSRFEHGGGRRQFGGGRFSERSGNGGGNRNSRFSHPRGNSFDSARDNGQQRGDGNRGGRGSYDEASFQQRGDGNRGGNGNRGGRGNYNEASFPQRGNENRGGNKFRNDLGYERNSSRSGAQNSRSSVYSSDRFYSADRSRSGDSGASSGQHKTRVFRASTPRDRDGAPRNTRSSNRGDGDRGGSGNRGNQNSHSRHNRSDIDVF